MKLNLKGSLRVWLFAQCLSSHHTTSSSLNQLASWGDLQNSGSSRSSRPSSLRRLQSLASEKFQMSIAVCSFRFQSFGSELQTCHRCRLRQPVVDHFFGNDATKLTQRRFDSFPEWSACLLIMSPILQTSAESHADVSFLTTTHPFSLFSCLSLRSSPVSILSGGPSCSSASSSGRSFLQASETMLPSSKNLPTMTTLSRSTPCAIRTQSTLMSCAKSFRLFTVSLWTAPSWDRMRGTITAITTFFSLVSCVAHGGTYRPSLWRYFSCLLLT